jgi:hypothetical protein
MATQYVTGASPVTFVSENVQSSIGKQYSIPIALLGITNGQPDPTDWLAAVNITAADPDYALVFSLVAGLTAQGAISVLTTP